MGSEVDQQKQVYDNAIDLHLNSFLSLQHEVYGTASSFLKSSFFEVDVPSLTDSTV